MSISALRRLLLPLLALALMLSVPRSALAGGPSLFHLDVQGSETLTQGFNSYGQAVGVASALMEFWTNSPSPPANEVDIVFVLEVDGSTYATYDTGDISRDPDNPTTVAIDWEPVLSSGTHHLAFYCYYGSSLRLDQPEDHIFLEEEDVTVP